jgi:hypothetical protein
VLLAEARLELLHEEREVIGKSEPDSFARERLRERASIGIPRESLHDATSDFSTVMTRSRSATSSSSRRPARSPAARPGEARQR